MKIILLMTVLLILASCGGGGGGGSERSKRSKRSGANGLQEDEIIACFEDALGWIDLPPETHIAALESIQGTDLRDCGGDKEMRIYVKAVIEQTNEEEYEEEK